MRRVAVSGVEGYHVTLLPDGTSWLEGPDGKKRQLVDAAFVGSSSTPPPGEVSIRVLRPGAEVLESLPGKGRGPGQLIVLDEGVVDVPRDAQITLVEKNRLVVATGDGSSIVYHADGRVESRQRLKDVRPRSATRATQESRDGRLLAPDR